MIRLLWPSVSQHQVQWKGHHNSVDYLVGADLRAGVWGRSVGVGTEG